ncbi:serine protease 33-like [Oculina patagonica]
MKLWSKEPLTLLALAIIQVCCGGTALPGDRLSIYQQERLFGDSQTCGKQFLRPQVKRSGRTRIRSHVMSKRIVGGSWSGDGAWPWQVALLLDDTQVCGGSLISSNWILTACHCFTDYRSSTDPTRWKVKLGAHPTASKETRFEEIREVKNIILHPKYWGKTEHGVLVQPPDYDVALLELSSPVTYDSHVLPVCLATSDMAFPPGKTCFITGWGTKGWNKPQSTFLQEAPIRLVSREECNEKKSYNGTVPLTALCAGFQDGRIDACQKDSGGPLACDHEGRWYLVGVISWGKKCALPNKYGVYADVRVLHAWITNVIQQQK